MTEDAVFSVLKHNLSRLLPIRVVLLTDGGQVKGLVEHSYSMEWSNTHVNIFWSGKAATYLGDLTIDGIKSAEQHNTVAFSVVIDPFSEDCPIDIDWESWVAAKSKFYQRNAPFKMKGTK